MFAFRLYYCLYEHLDAIMVYVLACRVCTIVGKAFEFWYDSILYNTEYTAVSMACLCSAAAWSG